MSVTQRTREQALDALDGMAQIVRRERLVRGDYVSDDFDPAQSDAICQGHRYCAVGSLWAGAGIPVKRHTWVGNDVWSELPGTGQGERKSFLRRRPGLRLALASLNDAASRFIKRHPETTPDFDEFNDAIEALFEGDKNIGRPELLRIIATAKRSVKSA